MIQAIFSDNDYFQLFGNHHIGAILFFIIVGIILVRYGRTLDENGKVRLGTISALIIPCFSIFYLSTLIITGKFNYIEDLPLNLCTLLPFVMPWLMYTQNKIMYGILYFAVLGGTMQGILTPDLRGLGFPNYVYIKFWVEHAGLVILILYATFVYKMRPTWKDFRNSVLFLVFFYLIFLMTFNYFVGSNYGYTMAKPPGESVLDLFGDWPWYIIIAVSLVFPLFFLLYLPFLIKDLKKK